MAIDLNRARVSIQPHVRVSLGSDGAVLLDLECGAYLSLNRTGGRIWSRLTDGAAPQAIASELAASCGIDERRVQADVQNFLGNLQERGLVRIDHQ